MKKITFLSILLFSCIGFSQQQQYNLGFEPSTPSGNIANWVTFENPSPAAEIVTNPDPDGVNNSATTSVLKLNMTQNSACYSGTINTHGTLGTWQLDSAVPSNLTLSMQVNKNIVGKVGIKFANATNGTLFEIKDDQGLVNTVNEWVTLTWDISGFNVGDNINIDQMVVFIDWRCTGETPRPSDVQLLVDNITWGANKLTDPASCTDGIQNGSETGVDCGGNCAPCAGQEPLVSAPTPPARNAEDVISIFSDAYANVSLSELPTTWSQLGTFTPIEIETNNDTWRITGCEFLGMVTNYAAGVDLSTMETMHIDYWTPDSNPIGVKIVNTVDGGEAIAPLGATVTGSWQSIDVNMSAFSALTNKTKITQLLIDPSAPSILYIDNFYFYKTPSGSSCSDGIQNGDETGIDCGGSCPNACVSQIDLPVTFEGNSIDYTVIDFGNNQSTKIVDPTDASNTVIRTVKPVSAPLWAGTTIGSVLANPIPLTATDTKMNVRVWSPDAGIVVRLKVEDPLDPTRSCETDTFTTVAGGWQTMEFDFANEAPGTAPLNLAYNFQRVSIFFNFGVDGATAGEKTYYFDDVNFGPGLAVESFSSANVAVYPNPTSNILTIESIKTIDSISVFNLLGQEVMKLSPSNTSSTFSIASLESGVYVVKINSEGISSTGKVIKN